ASRTHLGTVPAGVHTFAIAADTAPGPAVLHLLVYASSSLAEQTTPSSTVIFDRSASVSDISFVDHDLDIREFSGNVSWVEPPSLERVEAYRVYLAENAEGSGRSRMGDEVAAGSSRILMPAETKQGDATHIVVYARSVLAEQTTPVAFLVSDTAFSVANVSFPDLDLDLADLGGTLAWIPYVDDAQVTHYNVYFATACLSSATADLVVNVDVNAVLNLINESNESNFTDETSLSNVSNTSEDVSDTSGSSDNDTNDTADLAVQSSLSNVSNTSDPLSESANASRRLRVDFLDDFVAEAADSDGPSRGLSAMAQDSDGLVWNTTNASDNASDTDTNVSQVSDNYSELSLNATSTTTSSTFTITSTSTTVSTTTTVTTTSTSSNSFLTVAELPPICAREFVAKVPVGTTTFVILPETSIRNFTHFLVFAVSSMAEQVAPSGGVLIDDASASVSGIVFVDQDLDRLDLGGNISWQPADFDFDAGLSAGRVGSYNVYLAFDEVGAGRSQVGSSLEVGYQEQDVLAETPLSSRTHVLVYTASTLVEQTTPVALPLVDTNSSVSNIDFPDFDLDATDLGGVLAWTTPAEFGQVVSYEVYFASGLVLVDNETYLCPASESQETTPAPME
ncbi:unnamed protein product, partial [Polarella glacialis]